MKIHIAESTVRDIARQIFSEVFGEKKRSANAFTAQYPSSGLAGIRFMIARIRLAEAKASEKLKFIHKINEKIFASGPDNAIKISEK